MKFPDNLIEIAKEMLKIRSPSKEFIGDYTCEKCKFHQDCICVVCEDGGTVICTKKHKHVNRYGTCKSFVDENSIDILKGE